MTHKIVTVSDEDKQRMLEEAIERTNRGEYDNDFDGCPDVRLVPDTLEEINKAISILAKHIANMPD